MFGSYLGIKTYLGYRKNPGYGSCGPYNRLNRGSSGNCSYSTNPHSGLRRKYQSCHIRNQSLWGKKHSKWCYKSSWLTSIRDRGQ